MQQILNINLQCGLNAERKTIVRLVRDTETGIVTQRQHFTREEIREGVERMVRKALRPERHVLDIIGDLQEQNRVVDADAKRFRK